MNVRNLSYGSRNVGFAIAAIFALAFSALSLTGCGDTNNSTTLAGITLDTSQVKKSYAPNERLDLSGLVIIAGYTDGSSAKVSYNYTTSPMNGDILSTAGQITVTVSYTEGGVTKTADFSVTVAVPSVITYTAAQTGGEDGTATTTGIVFTFSESVDSLNLNADDIAVSGAAEKAAALTGTGAVRTLPITVSAAGLASVSINKSGIEAATKTVIVYKEGEIAPEYWNITWHLNGGAAGTGAYPTLVVKGAALARPSSNPVKAGNTFGGWYTDSGLTQAYNFAAAVTADINLYAKWEAVVGASMEEAIPLTANQWADGNLPAGGEQWFTFTATAATQYIHVDLGTLTSAYVQVYNSSGTAVGSASSGGSTLMLTPGQTYYIEVRSYSSSGTYWIGFNTTTTVPHIQPPSTAVPLTANQWADGNIPMAGDRQWFIFTATAATQYIHVDFGTLTSVYVQVYNSSGTAEGSETRLYSSTRNTLLTLTSGQTYYIRVRTMGYSGIYRIGFNTTPYPPDTTFTTLTADQWADGDLPTSSAVQWFTFTATTATQYIHVDFGTLTDLYVQVYNSSGTVVGSETRLYSSTINTTRALTQGQTYYIRVRPSYSSGTYWIAFNTSSSNTGITVQLPSTAVPLTANQWADGDLPTSGDRQWFTFTATAATQYIHVDFGTLTDLYVQVYNSSGTVVGSETRLYSSTINTTRALTQGQTYYIRVRPMSGSSYSGTYRIGFNTTLYPPDTTFTTLTADQWADGDLPTSSAVQWFTFTATAATQYIYVDFGTLTDHLYVQVYNSSGTAEGSETDLHSSTRNTSRTLTSGQTYYIRVRPYSSSNSGTYKIAFNTTTTAPPVQLPSTATQLTADQWANGNIPTVGDRQWFTFTATATTQYIHVSFSTLTNLYVQVYNSSGTTEESETNLYTSTNTSRTLTSGQVYYIRVRTYSSSGTYKIGFNTSSTAPAQ